MSGRRPWMAHLSAYGVAYLFLAPGAISLIAWLVTG